MVFADKTHDLELKFVFIVVFQILETETEKIIDPLLWKVAEYHTKFVI